MRVLLLCFAFALAACGEETGTYVRYTERWTCTDANGPFVVQGDRVWVENGYAAVRIMWQENYPLSSGGERSVAEPYSCAKERVRDETL